MRAQDVKPGRWYELRDGRVGQALDARPTYPARPLLEFPAVPGGNVGHQERVPAGHVNREVPAPERRNA